MLRACRLIGPAFRPFLFPVSIIGRSISSLLLEFLKQTKRLARPKPAEAPGSFPKRKRSPGGGSRRERLGVGR
jgi:hypothetical protein